MQTKPAITKLSKAQIKAIRAKFKLFWLPLVPRGCKRAAA